jgi:Fuc2NAc and GlcNAc transferase
MTSVPVLLLAVFASSVLLTGAMRRYAIEKELLDIPNIRSSHDVSTPRGGGVAIVVPYLLTLIVAWQLMGVETTLTLAVFGSGGLVAGIGYWDDLGHVSWKLRLLMHSIAAFWAIYWLKGTPTLIFGDTIIHLGWFGIITVAIFLMWLLNLFNFMDGIDGIAGSEAVFIATTGGLLTWLSGHNNISVLFLLLAAATLGFLWWNWPPAKIFMGDVGSGFLGIVLGILAYASVMEGDSIWVWLILFGVFLADSGLTLTKRVLRGERWYEAHCSHAYQWSARKWGHLRVTLSVLMINCLWLFPIALLAFYFPDWGFALALIALIPLIILAAKLGAGRPE